MSGEAIIRISGLSKDYQTAAGAVPALENISLSIFPGEFVAVMGPSGSGKSTFMNLLGCLDVPTGGSYFLNGTDVRTLDKDQLARLRNSVIGFVFQGFNLLPRASLIDNVALPLVYAGVGRGERIRRAQEMLDKVGLGDRRDHFPMQLSGGQQQRVAIARALAMDPHVMLFDEVTSALDPELVRGVLDVMKDLALGGMTMLVVTHEMQFAHDIASRVWVIDQGTIAEDGPPSQVVDDPKTDVAREFFGRIRK